ncbi:DUF2790 domain-containing protein [Stutzerimonas zhaodongensis]|uniref:DUF2790 domain-containing protein n=1 Tax=Stutzerimonas zhaodongensis TaxID=1176257 RepID=UPI0021046099|nr:DUF2790 domain-containing protein [Stutzerimonas zhaodongensis]MCQ2028941.1 DUF2790 domain-containing protein [Stutzerimonas zhaodongensis]
MTFKTFTAACLLTVLSVGALPAMAQGNAKSETYSYGTQLDISQVISLTEDAGQVCGLVNAHLSYLDSVGEQRGLTYLKQAANCNDGG